MKRFPAILILSIAVVLMLGGLFQTAYAQEAMETITNAKATIGEDDQISTLVPWIVAIVLSLAAVVVSFKNAKRGHQD
ncbi:MAG: hypothetical protein JW936_01200 [Sedimentisphaerales bacterium]|nr:hypothetical protein [Sedimentisphaerales bacterium]